MGQKLKIVAKLVIASSLLASVAIAEENTATTTTEADAANATLRLAGDDQKAAQEKADKIAKAFAKKELAEKMAKEKAAAEAKKIADTLAAQKAAAVKAKAQAEQDAQKAAAEAKAKAEQEAKIYNAKLRAEIEKYVSDKISADAKEAQAKLDAAAAEKAALEKAAIDKINAQIAAEEKAKTDKAAAQLAEIEKFVSDGIAANNAAAIEFEKNNLLGVKDRQQKTFLVYANFPNIAFNPTKPVKNPLTVYKLRNIVHNLPALDGLTRLNLQKFAKGNSVIKGLKIWKAERKLLQRTLILNNYKSLWFDNYVLNKEKANEIIATVENAENFALRPSSYKLDELKAMIDASGTPIDDAWLQVPGSTQTLNEMAKQQAALSQTALANAKLEMALTHVAFAYSRHASAGQLIPSQVNRNLDVHPKATAANKILQQIKVSSRKGELQTWLEAQNPQSVQFTALLAEFKKQSGITEKPIEPIIVPKGKSLKKGLKSKRVIKLAMRLEQLGFYNKTVDGEYPQVVNETIIASVIAYQESRGLVPDGIAGPATIGSMNYKKPDYLKTLLVNLERQRWMPRQLGYKHVLVNQAEFRLRVFENDKVTHTARVVIGKNKHQTPVFYNKIRSVVVNPYWNIPSSILYNEMKNKINNDPSYLSRNGYEVVGNVNWENASARHVKFRVRQKPGGRNALGRVKFLFPNRHSIYLHDTPSKSLFNRASRAFSHGCIRVQNPELLALNLMGWSKNKFNSLVKAGRNRHFALKNKIPVYLTYMTASVNKEGEMRYFRDVYGRDKLIAKALGVTATLKKIADKNQAKSPAAQPANAIVISSK